MLKKFTLVEAVLIVFCVALLSTLVIGMTSGGTPQEARCADKMRKLLSVAHQYAEDNQGMWMAPKNLPGGAYVRCLVDGGYLKTPWNTLMTASESEITCPSLPRVARYKVIQGYGSVYNNGSDYDPQRGLYIYSPEYSFIRTKSGKTPIASSKRIWFADSMTQLKPPYPSPLLAGYGKGENVFGSVNITHDGRANIGAVDGSVTAVSPDELNGYYLPLTGGNPLRHRSAPLRVYRERGVEYEVKR